MLFTVVMELHLYSLRLLWTAVRGASTSPTPTSRGRVHRRAAACSWTSVNRARHRCSSAADVAGIRRRRRSPDDADAVVVGLCRHSLEREQRP